MRTLYIAGPMTGIEDYNRPAFFDAEGKLRDQGFLVINPAIIRKHRDTLKGDQIWQYYMREALKLLLSAKEIALLPGWQDSRGAKLEALTAQHLGMPTWDYRDGQLHEPGTVPPLDALGDLAAHSPAGGV